MNLFYIVVLSLHIIQIKRKKNICYITGYNNSEQIINKREVTDSNGIRRNMFYFRIVLYNS